MDALGRFLVFFLFFSLGLLASSSASVLPSSKLTENGSGSSLGDLRKEIQIEKFRNCPKMVPLSQKEWIEIIKGAHGGSPSNPRHLQESTFTLHVNQSGEFTNTLGEEGKWKAESSMTYLLGPEQIVISTLSIESMSLSAEGLQTVTGAMSEKVETVVSETTYVYASTTSEVTFTVDGGAYTLVEDVLEYSTGEVVQLDAEVDEFSSGAMALIDAEGSLSITTASSFGRTDIGEERCSFTGVLYFSSNPMSTGEVLSKDPVALAEALKASVGNPMVLETASSFHGEFALGNEGDYLTGSESETVDLITTTSFNTTSLESGFYWQVNSRDVDKEVLRKGLLTSMIDSFFV